ncbi:MAG TPA: sigma-70 family RNA polymerase sigma factor [Acidimicrobiia bacterium]|nr:sigma-70 family RNA polymerase sigma factor [Acidimicrobiia bacterium]
MVSTHDIGGGEANDLVLENLELVSQLVQQMAARYPRHVDRGELWSAGVLGLVEASRRFDPAMGIPFPRYAAIRIRGAIIDSTRSRDWASRRVRRQVRELEATEASMRAGGDTPTEEELAEMVGTTPERIRDLRARAEKAALLSLEWSPDEEGESLANRIEETDTEFLPEERLEDEELMGTLETAIEHLPPVQREVIERYYLKEEMLAEIAADLGVTVARTSQIRSEAINAIRAYLAGLYHGVPEVAPNAPGHQMRAQYLADLATHSTWRSRLEAGSRRLRAIS